MFRGKTCVLMGATNTIGRFTAEQFATEECNIAFLDSNLEKGNRLKKLLKDKYGVDVFFFHGKFTSEEDLEIFANYVIEKFGMIDFFINHISCDKELLSGVNSFEDVQTMFQVSVLVPYILDRIFQNHFWKGAVEVFGIPAKTLLKEEDKYSYSMIRGAVESFAKTCAEKYGGKVHVSCIDKSEEEKLKKEILNIIHYIRQQDYIYMSQNDEFEKEQDNTMKMIVYPGQNGWQFLKN